MSVNKSEARQLLVDLKAAYKSLHADQRICVSLALRGVALDVEDMENITNERETINC